MKYLGDSKNYEQTVFKKGAELLSERESKILIKLLHPKKNSKVLELGVGSGRLSSKISLLVNELHGIELSNKMIKQLNKKKINNLILTHADLNKGLPFDESSFELIYSVRVFKYLKDIDKSLSEVSRVLDKKGVVVIEFPGLISAELISKIRKKCFTNLPTYKLFTSWQIRSIAKKHNLIIKKIVVVNRIPLSLWYRNGRVALILNNLLSKIFPCDIATMSYMVKFEKC